MKVCLKKLGIRSGLYGKSVLYLLFSTWCLTFSKLWKDGNCSPIKFTHLFRKCNKISFDVTYYISTKKLRHFIKKCWPSQNIWTSTCWREVTEEPQVPPPLSWITRIKKSSSQDSKTQCKHYISSTICAWKKMLMQFSYILHTVPNMTPKVTSKFWS